VATLKKDPAGAYVARGYRIAGSVSESDPTGNDWDFYFSRNPLTFWPIASCFEDSAFSALDIHPDNGLDMRNANRYFATHTEGENMKIARMMLIATVVVGSLAVAYFLGSQSKESSQTTQNTGISTQPISDSFLIPTGLTVVKMDELPPMTNPTGVLLSEVKVPKNLLNGSEQVATDFIVPNIQLEVK